MPDHFMGSVVEHCHMDFRSCTALKGRRIPSKPAWGPKHVDPCEAVEEACGHSSADICYGLAEISQLLAIDLGL